QVRGHLRNICCVTLIEIECAKSVSPTSWRFRTRVNFLAPCFNHERKQKSRPNCLFLIANAFASTDVSFWTSNCLIRGVNAVAVTGMQQGIMAALGSAAPQLVAAPWAAPAQNGFLDLMNTLLPAQNKDSGAEAIPSPANQANPMLTSSAAKLDEKLLRS